MYHGKRRQRTYQRVDSDVQGATPEHLRIEIDQIFKEFLENTEESEYIFPADLNNLQRKYIHEKAKTMNLISKSYGNPPNRKLHIKKKPKSSTCHSYILEPCIEAVSLLNNFFQHRQICPPNREPNTRLFGEVLFGKLSDLPLTRVTPANVPEDIQTFKNKLPVSALRNEILEKIKNNQVVIVSSETGSGKTTQIPQFILEEMYHKNLPCKIICTQPRRIATVAVAERVSEERGDLVGGSVGYHIRLEQKYGPSTNLIYCTNGVMLRSLMCGTRVLGNITHLIIDEVHERDRLSDFLLICIKENLAKYPNLRIILMSATVNVEKFRNYFGQAEVLSLPGRLFHIEEFFLDDILVHLRYMSPAMKNAFAMGELNAPVPTICEFQNPDMDAALEAYYNDGPDEQSQAAIQLKVYFFSEDIPADYQHSSSGLTALMIAAKHDDRPFISELLNLGANIHLHCRQGKTALQFAKEKGNATAFQMMNMFNSDQNNISQEERFIKLYDKTISDQEIDYELMMVLLKDIHENHKLGAILIFLPGYDDIMMCNDYIMNSGIDRRTIKTFFLHGSMNIREQHDAFKHFSTKRKIILATNIAETSLTIDDVVYVIDCGKAKEKSYDSYNKLTTLQTQWISKACVKQRAGRAGRTCPGFCFHMFSRQRYQNMDTERLAEILRVSLEELCLHTKILAPQDMKIYTFLEKAPDKPSLNAVKAAIENLVALGALDENENLTLLGDYLSKLTVEPHLGKMLLYGVAFRCLEPILTLAACLSHKDPFQLPPQANLKTAAAEKRKSLTYDVPSDHLIYLKAFLQWQEDTQRGKGVEFCREYFISKTTMESILDTRRQLLGQLRAAGFVPMTNSISEYNIHSESWPMVKAIIASGLYPHIAFPLSQVYQDGTCCTKTEKKVYIPNTSVVHKNTAYTWLVFDEMNKNRQNFCIRGITAVSPITIPLVCGNEISPGEAPCSFTIDGWLEIEESRELLIKFRTALQKLINKTLKEICPSYTAHDNKILETFRDVLLQEDLVLQLPQVAGIGARPNFLHNVVEKNRFQRQNPFDLSEQCRRDFGTSSERRFNKYQNRNYAQTNGFNSRNSTVLVEKTSQNLSRMNFNCGNQNAGKPQTYTQDDRYFEITEANVYILIKPREVSNVNIGYATSTWVFSPQTEKKILHYHRKGKKVFLIFIPLSTMTIQGIATFGSLDKTNCNGKPTASIVWVYKLPIHFNKVRHLRNSYNGDRPIFDGLDGQIVHHLVAEELLRIYRESGSPGPSWQK